DDARLRDVGPIVQRPEPVRARRRDRDRPDVSLPSLSALRGAQAEERLVMAVAEVEQPALRAQAEPRNVAQRLAKAPLNLLLLLVAILWILPAAGLFVTSIIPAAAANAEGWWNVFSKPSEATFENYRNMFDNSAIKHALWVTVFVT